MADGEHHSLACTEEGQVFIWGRCDDGQAGMDLAGVPGDKLIFDDRDRPRILAPTLIPGLSSVAVVAAGIDHSFAVTSHGAAYSWGFGANYRTGLGTDETVGKPKEVLAEKGVSAAACGGQFSVFSGPAWWGTGMYSKSHEDIVLAGPAGMEKYKILASRESGLGTQ